MFDISLDSIIIHSKLVYWGIEALIVFAAMSIDLASGISKAKQRGEMTSSRLLRKSVSKFITYEGSLFLGLLVDILIYISKLFEVFHKFFDFEHIFLGIPVVSSIIAMFLVSIEMKSIFEKADQKLSNTAADEFLLLKNLAKSLGPAKLKDVIEVLEKTKEQKAILLEEEERKKRENRRKKEEEKLAQIEELKKKLKQLEGSDERDNNKITPPKKRGRKKKEVSKTEN
jgi:hypothetical protein